MVQERETLVLYRLMLQLLLDETGAVHANATDKEYSTSLKHKDVHVIPPWRVDRKFLSTSIEMHVAQSTSSVLGRGAPSKNAMSRPDGYDPFDDCNPLDHLMKPVK